MNISKFCIKHKVTTLLAVIMVSIFGVVFTGIVLVFIAIA